MEWRNWWQFSTGGRCKDSIIPLVSFGRIVLGRPHMVLDEALLLGSHLISLTA